MMMTIWALRLPDDLFAEQNVADDLDGYTMKDEEGEDIFEEEDEAFEGISSVMTHRWTSMAVTRFNRRVLQDGI